MLESLGMLILGLVVLIFSGDFLVRGAVGIALRMNIAPMVVGLTVVAFGTSAPELLISLNAAMKGSPDIAVGNVIGSNIANITLVLGISAMIFPIAIDKGTIKSDWPVMMLLSIGLFALAADGVLTWYEGGIFLTVLLLFVAYHVRSAMKVRGDGELPKEHVAPRAAKSIWLLVGFLAVGIGGMYFGSEWMLDGAVNLAREAGLSEHLIGVTIVAVGTSVPELVTSVVAAVKKQTEISVGNLVGSNIFNIGTVLGITAMVKETHVSNEVLNFDIWVVIGTAAILLPLMLAGRKLHRWKGGVLLALYLGYIIKLVFSTIS